ncbi:hypothetical protein GCM10010429_18430 [Micromonospora olivasterospora]
MSWGLPYAAFVSGASVIMPDRFLQAAPIAEMIAAERPTLAGAVPTIWTDLLGYLDGRDVDTASLREVIVGGSACPPALMHAFHERHGIEIVHAWGMTEMSPLGSVARPPAGATGEDAWRYRYTQGRIPAGVAARIVGPSGEPLPADGASVGELEVRGPWVTARYVGDDGPDPPEELREFLAKSVAHWQLPERWAFVDAVPKTSVGKFDKKVLRSRYAEGGLPVRELTAP